MFNVERFDAVIGDMKAASENPETPQWAKALTNCIIVMISELRDPLIHVSELESKINNLEKENNKLNERLDNIEQRSRNINLVVHGIAETNGENTDDMVMDVVQNNLGITLNIDDIQRSHRLGPVKQTRETRNSKNFPRPIIFKLVSFRKRIWRFLEKYKLLKSVLEKVGRGNAWSTQGRILCKWHNNIVHVNNQADVNLLQ